MLKDETNLYGNVVVDDDTLHVLDLDTMTWIPVNGRYPECRGGVLGVVYCKEQQCWILSGEITHFMH